MLQLLFPELCLQLCASAVHSSINQQWDDAISYALQRNEHGGHMRGVGSGPFRRQMAKEEGFCKRRKASSKKQSSEKLDEKIRVLAREELRKLMRLARDQHDVDNFIDHGVFPEAPIQPTPPASDPSPLQNKSTSCSGTECQLDLLGAPDKNLTKGVKCRLHIPTVGNPLGARGLLMPRTAVVHHVTLRDDMVRVQVDPVLRGFEDEPVPYPPHEEATTLRDCVNSYLTWPRRLVVLATEPSPSPSPPLSVSTRPARDVSIAAWRLTRSFRLRAHGTRLLTCGGVRRRQCRQKSSVAAQTRSPESIRTKTRPSESRSTISPVGEPSKCPVGMQVPQKPDSSDFLRRMKNKKGTGGKASKGSSKEGKQSSSTGRQPKTAPQIEGIWEEWQTF